MWPHLNFSLSLVRTRIVQIYFGWIRSSRRTRHGARLNWRAPYHEDRQPPHVDARGNRSTWPMHAQPATSPPFVSRSIPIYQSRWWYLNLHNKQIGVIKGPTLTRSAPFLQNSQTLLKLREETRLGTRQGGVLHFGAEGTQGIFLVQSKMAKC